MIGIDLTVWDMVLSTERRLHDRQLARLARIGRPPAPRSIVARLFRRVPVASGAMEEMPPARLRPAPGA